MKLSNKLEKAINEQINLELSSAYAYLGMAAYFNQTPFSGFARWMDLQSGEEIGHAHKFFDYVVERGGKVSLKAIGEPKCEFKGPLEVFQAALAHEQRVSAAIAGLYELAQAEKDYATAAFLKWFLDEQVEEERNVTDFIMKLELAGDHVSGLIQIDRLAALRTKEG